MLPIPINPLDLLTAPIRALKSAGSALIREAFQWIVGLMLSGVAWFFTVVWNFISTATTPDLYAAWFTGGPYRIVTVLAASLLMLTVTLAIAEGIWNRDGPGLLRSVAQDLPKAMFLLTGLLFISTLGIAIADAITNALLGVFGDGVGTFTDALTSVDNELGFGAGLLVVILMALLLVLVLGVVALELVFREGFIFVLVAITALAVVFDVYRPTRGAGARAGRLLAGVIAAKPIIALCFAIGGAALGGPHGSESAGADKAAVPEPGGADAGDPAPGSGLVPAGTDPAQGDDADDLGPTMGALLAGLATMSLAGFAPFTVLKLFPVAEATAADGARAAVTSKATSAVTSVAAVAAGGAASAGGAHTAGGTSGGGAGPGAGQAAGSGSAARKAGAA
jgi:hypothetical protein